MDKDPMELMQELAESLDGTCLHEWSIALSAARGGLILENQSGQRFAAQLSAYPLPNKSEGQER